MKKQIVFALIVGSLLLSGCESLVAPRYSISADNNVAIKALGVTSVGVGPFAEPAKFESGCRAVGALEVADGITHTQYIRKALEDELKVAGIYVEKSARITLSGAVTRLEFSSTRGLTGGSWDIDLNIQSSNGTNMTLTEHHEFQSGFVGTTACKQTAEAFAPTVQNLLGKLVRSPDFQRLVK